MGDVAGTKLRHFRPNFHRFGTRCASHRPARTVTYCLGSGGDLTGLRQPVPDDDRPWDLQKRYRLLRLKSLPEHPSRY